MHKWTKPEVEGFLARERLTYQKITLPFGLETPGDARPAMCDSIFQDVAGRSVLDVGSYLGYFCQEALTRGATSAHGIEADPEKVRQSIALAEMNGLAPTFTVGDIEAIELKQPYDVVLCLNVIHHLFDPIGTLLRLARSTRHKLVLEVASLGPRDGRKLGLGFLRRHALASLPVLYAARGAPDARQRTNAQKYFFTPEALRTILGSHTNLFHDVEITPSSFKRRFVVVARRRKVRRLLVVSGPSGVGKTTFLRRLADGSLPATLRSRLPAGCETWPQIREVDLADAPGAGTVLAQPELAGAVLRYDFLRPLESGTHTFRRDQALDLLACADEIAVVALRTDEAELLRRFDASAPPPGRSKRRRWHREQLRKDYASERWLQSWYERWQQFVSTEYPSAVYSELTWS